MKSDQLSVYSYQFTVISLQLSVVMNAHQKKSPAPFGNRRSSGIGEAFKGRFAYAYLSKKTMPAVLVFDANS